jgi:uncharacterized protein (TIGR01319 family)
VSVLHVCVDFGSTFTKVVAVDDEGRLAASGSARTTIESDVMEGYDAALSDAGVGDGGAAHTLACSSAGGGLRIAVVGYERAITAEAGYRVGLSAGGKVCHVTSGQLGAEDVTALVATRPDVVLLVGGTDGGNSDVLVHNAQALARAGLTTPVVVAGNKAARTRVIRILRRSKVTASGADNVLPTIGVLDPRSAREAIREVFISHVIGGKHLSARVDLSTWVQAATPDAVLSGVELLADGTEEHPGVGDVGVVEVGGATPDVYSVTSPDLDHDPAEREAVATMWRSRTVEGDLGVRWNAPGIVDAARREGFLVSGDDQLSTPAEARRADPGYLPTTSQDRAIDRELARLAAAVALRRHARPHTVGAVRYPGKDLSKVSLVVGSGGVLRHSPARVSTALVKAAVDDPSGGWRTPDNARFIVDTKYVLAAAGLISRSDPDLGMRLLRGTLLSRQ